MPKVIFKVFTMTNTDVGWSQIMYKYDDDTVTMTTNLDIMWITIYPGWKYMHMTTDVEFLVLILKYCIRLN